MDDIFLETIDFKNKMLLDKVLEWRNDIDTRNNSINTSIITEDIFHNIIEKYKSSKYKPLIIYYRNNTDKSIENNPIGILTFIGCNNDNNDNNDNDSVDAEYTDDINGTTSDIADDNKSEDNESGESYTSENEKEINKFRNIFDMDEIDTYIFLNNLSKSTMEISCRMYNNIRNTVSEELRELMRPPID